MVTHFRELRIYQAAFNSAMHIFGLSRNWPVEERYSLTGQVRRASRSVCASIAEAWGKRRYPNHFVSKLTDADSESYETQNWLSFALACGYLNQVDYDQLFRQYEDISRGLVGMMNHPDSWCGPANLAREPSSDYLPDPD